MAKTLVAATVYGFTSPAIVNTIYGRWWHPFVVDGDELDEFQVTNLRVGTPDGVSFKLECREELRTFVDRFGGFFFVCRVTENLLNSPTTE